MPPDSTPQFILSVQHNGMSDSVFDGLFVQRKETAWNDIGTLALAMSIYRAAFPHVTVVYNQIPRRFVDTNRDPEDPRLFRRAFEDQALKSYFFDFHETLETTIKESAGRHGFRTCLLDIHGFAEQPPYAPEGGFHVILGTRNRGSIVTSIDAEFSRTTLTPGWLDLDRKLSGVLCTKGLSVFCPDSEPIFQREWLNRVQKNYPQLDAFPRGNDTIDDPEADMEAGVLRPPPMSDWYDGGYLIGRFVHGSKRLAAAIQVEIASGLRKKNPEENVQRSSLVDSISEFIRETCS